MILVDSSVWINHAHQKDMVLDGLLERDEVLAHPLVIAELALGSLKNREDTLASLDDLPQAPEVLISEIRTFIEENRLYSKGIGFVDVTLLASCLLRKNTRLWTRDRRLNTIAAEFGIAFQPLH